MTKKEEILRVARKGNFANNRSDGSELACNSCGCWDYESKHEDNCPVGALLKLIESEMV